MYQLEVKSKSHEVIWLDLSQCEILRRGTQTQTLLTPDGRCFSVLTGERRRRWLESRRYDSDATWEEEV
jgi:hypothetical protein